MQAGKFARQSQFFCRVAYWSTSIHSIEDVTGLNGHHATSEEWKKTSSEYLNQVFYIFFSEDSHWGNMLNCYELLPFRSHETTMFRRFCFCPMTLPQLMAPLQYNHPDPSISIQSSDMARHCHSLLSLSQSPLRMNEEPPMDNPGNWLQKLLSVSCQQTVCFGGKVKEWEKPG
jgi:hypothetical protein